MMNQRWEEGRARWRPSGEIIRPSEYEVAEILTDDIPKAFVQQHHYSGDYPAARFRYGMYRHGGLVGVAVFSHPVNDRTLTNVFPVHRKEATELGRFVLLDEVPGNGETWFLARCFDALKKKEIVDDTGRELRGVLGVVSFSDPMPRATAAGEIVLPGHVGTIYQALSGTYLGRADGRRLHLLPDGRVFNHRTEQKIRKMEQGWKGAVQELQSYGAGPMDKVPAAWLSHWLPLVTRPLKHGGNHKYAWALDKHMRPALAAAREESKSPAYPKSTDKAAS